MKPLLSAFPPRLRSLSPVTVFLLGLAYEVAVGIADMWTPPIMNFMGFYLAGIALVAWKSTKGLSLLLAGICSLEILAAGLVLMRPMSGDFVVIWNGVTCLLVFLGAAWLSSEAARLNRNLGAQVEERTALWKAEAEKHKQAEAALLKDIAQRKRLERQLIEISDREQARIGQDLHDGLCQQLVSLAFDANSLSAQLAPQQLPEAAIAERIADSLDQAITEARQLSRGLFPIRLEEEGFVSALEELSATIRERFHLDCLLDCPEPVRIKSNTMATHLYRIAQEAVGNAVKHAQATRITIQLSTGVDGVELSVEDDGVGLPAGGVANSPGMGLHILDYRARTLGGKLRIEPGRARGTRVSLRLPARTE